MNLAVYLATLFLHTFYSVRVMQQKLLIPICIQNFYQLINISVQAARLGILKQENKPPIKQNTIGHN